MTMSATVTSTGTHGITWNGPVCATCGARYLGSHTCSTEDLTRRINELLALLPKSGPTDRMASCPCRPENGGSGVCGCTLGGPQVTCSVHIHGDVDPGAVAKQIKATLDRYDRRRGQ